MSFVENLLRRFGYVKLWSYGMTLTDAGQIVPLAAPLQPAPPMMMPTPPPMPTAQARQLAAPEPPQPPQPPQPPPHGNEAEDWDWSVALAKARSRGDQTQPSVPPEMHHPAMRVAGAPRPPRRRMAAGSQPPAPRPRPPRRPLPPLPPLPRYK